MKKLLSVFLAVLLVGSVFAVPAAAAPSDDLNFDDDRTPDPTIEWDTVEKATHDNQNMSSALGYYDDSGDPTTLNASLNSSLDEQVGVEYDKIDADAYGTFPRVSGEDTPLDVSAVDDSGDWTKDMAGSAGSATITDADGSIAGDAPAVEFSASSQTSGDVAKFTYSNFSSLDDGEKRVPFIGANFDSLPSGTEVQFRIEEDDGDYVVANASQAADASDDTTMTATNGATGVVWQNKIESMPVQGSGDGQLNSIDSVTVTIEDGDGTVTLYAFDSARKSAVTIGETMTDSDGDGELEATTIEDNTGGVVGLTEQSTLPSMFSDALIHDMEVYGVQFRMSDLVAEDDYRIEFSDADNYAFDRKLEFYGRITPPSAIDLTYSGGELTDRQGFISDRYKTVEIAEGISDTDFENVSSWTSVSDQYTGVNETHTLDSTIQVGQSYGVHGVIVLQNEEESEIKANSIGAGGGGGFWSGGNPVGTFVNGILASLAAIAASLGIISRRGS